MYHLDDTIAAIASASGSSARGIVRLSGPDAATILTRCFQADDARPLSAVTSPTVIAGRLRTDAAPDARWPLAPDCDLLFWPTARSYTRQPAAELHLIGSPPIVSAALAMLCAAGARVALPGEFTLRAFLAGRIDLTEAEAVLGAIEAGDRSQLDSALSQMAGGLARPLARLRESLLELLAHLEAGLDFSEEDLPFLEREELARTLRDASDEVAELAEQIGARAEAREGMKIVLLGLPNVGKSSLFNALAGEGKAIVSAAAGTTRDYLSATIDLAGVAMELIDTAGEDAARATPIGEAAQNMTQRQRGEADLRLLCFDASRPLEPEEASRLAAPRDDRDIVVLTKSDRPRAMTPPADAIATSAKSGEGLEELRERLLAATRDGSKKLKIVLATAVRARESVRLAGEALARAQQALQQGAGEELIAADLRLALNELGAVAGAVHTDDLLDRVFSRFCIGK